MDKIASCEISFIPIMSKNYIDEVKEVIEIIKCYDLEYNVGILSTTIRGSKEKIFDMVKEIYDKMDKKTNFTMDIKISNICGCKK
ncbi:YkoF family thiamine/hydroxymethylpyrimidine-binding protein [Caminicella sporogenes]|nr:YkoF family thiamine/hydroxymethylpyrimidine-binding protein [Caminicella sporogenes]WIF94041.1 YkoF family thiamine/hydroxymethylpyrimidine-binding protein [Caminicella sporogenes]